jgi:hypothetical protein
MAPARSGATPFSAAPSPAIDEGAVPAPSHESNVMELRFFPNAANASVSLLLEGGGLSDFGLSKVEDVGEGCISAARAPVVIAIGRRSILGIDVKTILEMEDLRVTIDLSFDMSFVGDGRPVHALIAVA